MRPQKVENKDLMLGLMSVLRDKGYEGASLNDLAKASGLQKASLYYRFPEGKKGIAKAVLQFVNEWFQQNVAGVIDDEDKTPQQQLKKVLDNINEIYQNGNKACILRAVSMDMGLELFSEELSENMYNWISAFTALGLSFGFKKDKAEDLATQVLINIQGSLVVSKGLHSNSYFVKTLKHIEQLYLNE